MEDRKVSWRTLVAYGSGDMYGGGSMLIIGMLYMFFLTDIAGLEPVLAGLAFGIGKVWDAVSDPLMGYFSDRTRSRFGRRRIYFLIGFLPVALSFMLLWSSSPWSTQAGLFAWYSIAYILFCTVFTMMMVPYSALVTELSPDYKVRTRLSGARIIFSQGAAILAGVLPKIIIGMRADPRAGYFLMGSFFAVLFALPWPFVFRATWEQENDDSARTGPSPGGVLTPFQEFGSLGHSRTCRIHLGMYLLAFTALDILLAVFAYFLTYTLERPELYSLTMGALLGTQVLCLPLYVIYANRRGKAAAFRIGIILWIVSCVLVLFAMRSETPTIVIVLICMLMGSGTSGATMIPWAILPSAVDVDEALSGRERSGLYAGAMTLSRKLVQGAIVMPIVGFLLDFIGFEAGQPQTAATQAGLRWLLLAGPMVLLVAAFLVSRRFLLTPDSHRVLQAELERVRNGGALAEADLETRNTIGALTGHPYGEAVVGVLSE